MNFVLNYGRCQAILMLYLFILLTDVIVKETVADFITTFFWQMLLPLLCEMVLLPTFVNIL